MIEIPTLMVLAALAVEPGVGGGNRIAMQIKTSILSGNWDWIGEMARRDISSVGPLFERMSKWMTSSRNLDELLLRMNVFYTMVSSANQFVGGHPELFHRPWFRPSLMARKLEQDPSTGKWFIDEGANYRVVALGDPIPEWGDFDPAIPDLSPQDRPMTWDTNGTRIRAIFREYDVTVRPRFYIREGRP